jgi:hypothetical protein
MDAGLGTGTWAFCQEADGTVQVDGQWSYSARVGQVVALVDCRFTDGVATIEEDEFAFHVTGTATGPGIGSSRFELTVTGTTDDGSAEGEYEMDFSAPRWPPLIGTFTATRTSGGGLLD